MDNLSLETLGGLRGGRVGHAANKAIQQALADCEDRPNLKKARTVTITVDMTPISHEGINLEAVQIDTKVKVSVPSMSLASEILKTTFDEEIQAVAAKIPREYQPPLIGRAEKE